MKLLHLFLALFTATFFLACSSDKEQLQVETNLTTNSEDMVALQASGALAYSWRQLSGTPVVLINANSATASFIAPSVSTEETLVFELEAVTVQFQNKNITLKKQVQVTVHPKVVSADSTDMNSTSGEVELEEEQSNETNTTTNETNTTAETNTTQPTVSLKSLKLTLEKNSLNVDTNTALRVVATYSDNSTKDVTNEVEWIYADKLAIDIKNNVLKTFHKDTNIFIQASLQNITSNAVALEIYKEINGHRLPPEPNPAINNATLLGVDSNDNGVRDDVERWIYEEYKEKHPVHIDIAMQAGRAYKQVLETPERALEIRENVNGALFCASYYQFDAEEFGDKKLINERIDAPVKSKYFNTKERNDVYWQYDTLLSGGSYDLPWDMKKYCDFNTSTYK